MLCARWMGVVATTAAMFVGIASAEAPKTSASAQGRLPQVSKGGMMFAIRSAKLTAPDTEKAPYPDQETTPGHGTLDASWPVAKSEALEWKTWNSAVLRATQELVNGNLEVKHKDGKASADGWNRSAIADEELDVKTSVLRVSDGIVSAKVYENIFEHGGVHPMEEWMYFHWLLKQGRELQVSDVFQPGAGWEDLVKKDCTQALQKQFAGTHYLWDDNGRFTKGEYTKGLSSTVETPRNWKLGPNGLTIVFPEYAVSPRVATPQDVIVSWTELRPYLQPGFAVPK